MVQVHHVLFHYLGHGNNTVCIFHDGFFQPAGGMVAVIELVSFPGSVGLQRMGGDNQGRLENILEQTPGHIGVPGMAMDHVSRIRNAGHDGIAQQSVPQFRPLQF
nr:hypothetical protein [uncultured Desulfobacter sp.]